MPSNIPQHVSQYLWDVDVSKLSLESHSRFVVERILEYGDIESIKWMNEAFSKDKIVDTLKKSKRISPKTGCLYALYFDIPKTELLCIQKPFTQKQNRF